MAGQTRAEYLETQIQHLPSSISHLESTIAHLENRGVEIYNNRTPCVFEETKHTRQRRQNEAHPPEIYKKSGEEFLTELKETLKNRKIELKNSETELAKLQSKS